MCLAPSSGWTRYTQQSRFPLTLLALFLTSGLSSCFSRNWINMASLCYERATVVINTSVLFFKKATWPKTSCEKQVVVQSKPNLALSVEVLSQVQHVPCCAKNTWRGGNVCIVPQRGVWCTRCHIQLDWLGSHTIANCLILRCPKGQKKRLIWRLGKLFSWFDYAVNTHLPHILYSLHVLWNVTAKWWIFKTIFLQGVYPVVESCLALMHVWCWLHSGEL